MAAQRMMRPRAQDAAFLTQYVTATVNTLHHAHKRIYKEDYTCKHCVLLISDYLRRLNFIMS